MPSVVWNTNIKELKNIIKHVGFAASTDVYDISVHPEIECLRCILTPSPHESTFFTVDGFRYSKWMTPVDVTGEIEIGIPLNVLVATINELSRSRDNVRIELSKEKVTLECGDRTFTLPSKKCDIDIESLVNMEIYEDPCFVMTVEDLLATGGKARVDGKVKVLQIHPVCAYNSTAYWYRIDWILGLLDNGKELSRGFCQSETYPHRYGEPMGLTRTYTIMNVNYRFWKEALAHLPKTTVVRISIGPNSMNPILMQAECRNGLYEAFIMPIVPYWNDPKYLNATSA